MFESQITFLPVADLDRSSAFYESILGLSLALDQGACRIYHVSPGGFIGLCARENAPAAAGVILTLVVEDVDAWHHRLAARGAAIESAPALNPRFNIYHFFARDPDGHRIEIQRFEDPRWRG